MSSFNQALEQILLNHVWGGQATGLPNVSGSWYIGLSTTTINNNGTGITEPADGYARVQVTNNIVNWPTASGGGPATKQNANEIAFPMATGNWGTVTHFFFSDSPSSVVGTDIYAFAALDVPRTIEANDTASFAAQAITITLD